MQKEKWLSKLIFDTELINHSFLSEKEIFALKSYLQDKKDFTQIGKEIELSDERVRQLIENGIGKILLSTKDLIVKSIWLQKTLAEKEMLQKELVAIKDKFKKELTSEQQLTFTFDQNEMPISNLLFSVRAKKVLVNLNIITVNQLEKLTMAKLNSIDNVGVKTVHEIIRRAEEIGIKIV